MTENKVVPSLRFRDFEREWIQSTLGNELDYTKGFAFKSNDYTDNGVRIVRVSDLLSSSIKTNNEKVFISKDDEYKYLKYKIQKGNIIITTVGSHPDLIESAVGRGIYILHNDEGLLNQNMLKLENNNTVNNKFIHSIINSPRYIHYIKAIKRGNANQANITVKELLQYTISLPPLTEQQKIASFLSAVDEKIQQLTKKKNLLEKYKKGVMQKIFSQELRFKDDSGNNYPDWKEKKLGEVCDVTIGGTPSTTKKEYWNGDIGWISSGAMNNGNVTQPSKLITKLGLDNSSAKIMPENTVMLAMTGATLGKIGYLKFNSSANQSVAGFLPNETYNSKYLFYTLKQGINQVFKYSGGAAQQGINKQSILNLKYKFPSLEEQQKTANFLTSLDTKIELVSTQIENTKAFKKGLLQQMFV